MPSYQAVVTDTATRELWVLNDARQQPPTYRPSGWFLAPGTGQPTMKTLMDMLRPMAQACESLRVKFSYVLYPSPWFLFGDQEARSSMDMAAFTLAQASSEADFVARMRKLITDAGVVIP